MVEDVIESCVLIVLNGSGVNFLWTHYSKREGSNMELFSRGQNGSDSASPAYGIDIGPHKMAAACFLSDEMADLIVTSANVFVLAARDTSETPLQLAKEIGGDLIEIGKALVWSREALQQIREIVEDNGDTWPSHTWDGGRGIPGHALSLITKALECFPKIPFVQPVDEQESLIRDMIITLKEQIVTHDEGDLDESEIAARNLIIRAEKAICDDLIILDPPPTSGIDYE